MITSIMPFHLTLLPLLSFTPINEVNSDYKVVPTRSEWNKTCMASELKEKSLKLLTKSKRRRYELYGRS